MTKKSLTILMVMTMVMAILAGCAPAATPTAAPAAPAAPAATEAVAAPAAATEAPAAAAPAAEVIMKGSNPGNPVYDFNPQVKANKPYNIAIIVKSQAAPVWESHLIAAAKAGKDMGVNILPYAPTKADNVAEQKAMLEDVATKGVDCVVLAPANSNAVQGPVASLVAKGIPVVYDNTQGAGDDYLSFVGVDSVQAGEVIGKTVAELMKGQGKLLILEGVPGQQTSDDRIKGIKSVLDKDYTGITYKSISAHWMFDEGRKVAEDTLQSWPDLGGIVGVGGNSAEGAAEAVDAAGLTGKVIVGAFDVQSPTVKAMKEGKEAFTISQGVYEQAYYSVAACVMALNGQQPPREIRTPIKVVMAAEVDKYDESPEVLKLR
ncbi:MAG: sugar ABC transporter substrate-binding protein [Anaerolineae bacterium]|nr:sugar ABC transporter substrate-binding protein [Anaerolineae bacterium]